MSNVADLVKAALQNKGEDTIKGALADALDEAHPNGKDGRAEILRLSMQYGGPFNFFHPRGTPARVDHHETLQLNPYTHIAHELTAVVHPVHLHLTPLYRVYLNHRPNDFNFLSDRVAEVPVTHEEARDLADHLPNAAEAHDFLDKRFGPDPRPTEARNRYARSYNRVLGESEM